MWKYPPEEERQKRNKSRSKSKSKSRSKSKSSAKGDKPNSMSYSYRGNFYFKQKSILLTYTHTENPKISKKELGDFLHDTFKPKVTVVCEETHQDGSPHLHAWLEWDEVFYTQNAFLFDYKNKHPNIGFIKDITKNTRSNALNYMMKQDDNL